MGYFVNSLWAKDVDNVVSYERKETFLIFCSTLFWSSKGWKGVCGWESKVENIKVGKRKPSLFSSKNNGVFWLHVIYLQKYICKKGAWYVGLVSKPKSISKKCYKLILYLCDC